jgi:hypothetical protein
MRDTLQDMSGRVKDRWDSARISSLDRQNMRLRDEVSHLRTRLEDERSETQDLKDVLRAEPKVVKVKKRPGLFRMAIVGGAAYFLGTRDGRERYDQIVHWFRSARSRMEHNADEVASEVEATAAQISNGADATRKATPSATPMTARTGTDRTKATNTGS